MIDLTERKFVMRLPDAYSKGIESNNNKLLQINQEAVKEIYKSISEVIAVLDLDNAEGKILEDYGEMLDVYRGKLNDKQYRAVIKAIIAANISKSDYMSVMHGLDYIFGKNNAHISEVEDSIATVKLDDMPYANLLETGLSANQIKDIVKKLIAIAVQIEESHFWGTFEFGSIPQEYDITKGFGNIEQTIGGYFGTIISGVTSIRTRKPKILVEPVNTRIVYNKPAKVTMTCKTNGAKIYYTTDGTDPSELSALYTEPFELYSSGYSGGTKTVKAIAYSDDLEPSIISECIITWKPAIRGTFEFASIEPIYDANAGFGNIEQTIGGYLGDYEVSIDEYMTDYVKNEDIHVLTEAEIANIVTYAKQGEQYDTSLTSTLATVYVKPTQIHELTEEEVAEIVMLAKQGGQYEEENETTEKDNSGVYVKKADVHELTEEEIEEIVSSAKGGV